MEHEIPFRNSNRENGTTFLDFPLFVGIFQWDEPTKRVPILTKWKAPLQILKKRTTTSTRISQAVLAREPASFLKENVILIFISLRVLGRVVVETCYQMLEVLRPVEGLTSSFNTDNSGNYSGEKSTMKLSGVSIFREYVKRTLSQISYSQSFSSPNLKVSIIETIFPKIWAKSLLKNEKCPFPVDVRRSKTSLLKLPFASSSSFKRSSGNFTASLLRSGHYVRVV